MSPKIPNPQHRPKRIIPKQGLFVEISPEKMVLFKAMLFEHSLTAHEFIGFVAGMWENRDCRILELLAAAPEFKKQLILDGKTKHIDAESIYKLISEMNDAKLNNKEK